MSTEMEKVKYDDMTKKALVAELNQRDEQDKHNGWSNRETWVFNLWISNDQGTYELTQEMAKDAYAEAIASEHKYTSTEKLSVAYMSEKLRNYLYMLEDEISYESREVRLMLNDVGSTWRVDFSEVAESIMDFDLLCKQ